MVVPLYACAPAPPPEAPPAAPAPPTTPVGNRPPVINSLTANPTVVTHGGTSRLACLASDADDDALSYAWSTTGGSIEGLGSLANWKAPDVDGDFIITVNVDDGKGGIVKGSATITVRSNQRPVINSIKAEPSKLIPSGVSTITCLASDPDGDTLVYSWSATSGSISGVGNIVTWKAPNIDGKFVINVVVDDGKGGIVKGECPITVETPQLTVTLKPVSGESGSISFAGDLATASIVGDNADNKGWRTFFSFDISGLSGVTIDTAKLAFTTKQLVGNPWNVSAFLFVEKVEYLTRPLQATDFGLEGIQLERFTSSVPEEIDVTLFLSRLVKPVPKPRFQVRIHLSNYTNGNRQDDYIEFSGATLTVTYTR